MLLQIFCSKMRRWLRPPFLFAVSLVETFPETGIVKCGLTNLPGTQGMKTDCLLRSAGALSFLTDLYVREQLC
ncbi:hypothetical protein EDC90_10146 [Martelella mediterranea]|uniref:Uncharacterized protein n=1 Tax=Martelella mediterranea TaxID=293089 RepID=A0A4V2V4H8_9HYPH|nr:hypothetical protein EDC90_10146 [Martelella mediterranea]